LSLLEQLRFFFQPFQLDLELVDLPVKFILQLVAVLLLTFAAVGKKIGERFQKLPAPLPDLVGMDFILTRDLSKRLFPLGGFESDFGFECGVMLSAHNDYLTIPPLGLWQVKMHLIALSEICGEAQSTRGGRGEDMAWYSSRR